MISSHGQEEIRRLVAAQHPPEVSAAFVFLIAFVMLRTALMTQRPTVEPRYLIECYPLVLSFCAVALCRKKQSRTAYRGDRYENTTSVQV